MWAKLVELLTKYLLIPLIEKGVKALYRKITEWNRKRKLKKENKKKVENYEQADNVDDAVDDFSELP